MCLGLLAVLCVFLTTSRPLQAKDFEQLATKSLDEAFEQLATKSEIEQRTKAYEQLAEAFEQIAEAFEQEAKENKELA